MTKIKSVTALNYSAKLPETDEEYNSADVATEALITAEAVRELVYNAIQTPDGTILRSRHRHDYVTHKDANGKTYMLDGGLDYIRCSAHKDQNSLSVFSDDPHEVQREHIDWGTYGIKGDQPLSYVTIAEMHTDHIKAVLLTASRIAPGIYNCMKTELEQR